MLTRLLLGLGVYLVWCKAQHPSCFKGEPHSTGREVLYPMLWSKAELGGVLLWRTQCARLRAGLGIASFLLVRINVDLICSSAVSDLLT